MNHPSVIWFDSASAPGVTFGIRCVSFRRRLELLQKVRELSGKQEFLAAGDSPQEQLSAAVLQREIDQLYLQWGVADVRGLQIDGEDAGLDQLLADGPEALCEEILTRLVGECGLDEEQTKN